MNWQKVFFWFKTGGQKPITAKLDQKLFSKIRPAVIPSWSQLKYVGRFLDPTEKKIIKIATAVSGLSLIAWAALFIFTNHIIVPASGGEYSEGLIGQPKFINPLFASTNDVDADIAALIYSGLFRYNENQKLVPDLAANHAISKDGKIYTINLRQDVKWSDGEAFTADDVIFTFETIQNPAVNSPLLPSFQGAKAQKINNYSVQFTLKKSFTPFLSSLTVGILPQHVWRDIAPNNIKLAKMNLQPVGAGPWKFNKLTKNETGNIQTYILTNNKHYYSQSPYLKTLVFKFYPDYSQAVNALKSQEIAGLSFIPRNFKQKISSNNYNLFTLELPQYTALFFNQESQPMLANNDLRLALARAIDKKKIIATIDNDGEIINSPFLHGYLGYDASSSAKYSSYYDLDKANKLLDKKWKKIQPEEYYKTRYNKLLKDKKGEIDNIKKTASSTPKIISSTIRAIEKNVGDAVRQEMNVNQSFYRRDQNGKILKLAITTVNTPEYKTIAEAVAIMWQAIGVTTNVNLVENFQIMNLLKKRDYEVLLYGEILGSDPDPYPFWHSSQGNYPGFNLAMFDNADADKILEDARTERTERKRADLYKTFQNILNTEMPAVFLYTPKYTWAVSKEIKGNSSNQIFHPADRFANVHNWYVKTKRKWKK